MVLSTDSGAAYVRRGGVWVLATWLHGRLLEGRENPLPRSHPDGFPHDHCLLGLFPGDGHDYVGAIPPSELAALLSAPESAAVDLFAADAGARAGNRPLTRVEADRAFAREMLTLPS